MVFFTYSGSKYARYYTGLVLFFLLSACADEPDNPESQIRQVIEAVELAAEQKSVKKVAEYLADEYQDKYHAKRQQALRTLLGYFYRKKNIFLFSRISGIQIDPDDAAKADARVVVAMTATQVDSAEKLLTLRAEVYSFDIKLGLIDDEWLITSAHWQKDSINKFL